MQVRFLIPSISLGIFFLFLKGVGRGVLTAPLWGILRPQRRAEDSLPYLGCARKEARLKLPHTLNHRKEIYRGRIVNLVVDDITTEQGINTIREVFQHPGGAAVVPVLPGGDVLLVRQFRYPMQEFLLELPAGKIDGSEPPEQTAARELGEEVGFKAGRLTKIAECYSTPGFCDEKLHIYLAEDLTPVQAAGDDDEDLEVVRLTRAELQEHLQHGRFRDAKTIIGIQHLLLQNRG